jgi:hypothetical protein
VPGALGWTRARSLFWATVRSLPRNPVHWQPPRVARRQLAIAQARTWRSRERWTSRDVSEGTARRPRKTIGRRRSTRTENSPANEGGWLGELAPARGTRDAMRSSPRTAGLVTRRAAPRAFDPGDPLRRRRSPAWPKKGPAVQGAISASPGCAALRDARLTRCGSAKVVAATLHLLGGRLSGVCSHLGRRFERAGDPRP